MFFAGFQEECGWICRYLEGEGQCGMKVSSRDSFLMPDFLFVSPASLRRQFRTPGQELFDRTDYIRTKTGCMLKAAVCVSLHHSYHSIFVRIESGNLVFLSFETRFPDEILTESGSIRYLSRSFLHLGDNLYTNPGTWGGLPGRWNHMPSAWYG